MYRPNMKPWRGKPQRECVFLRGGWTFIVGVLALLLFFSPQIGQTEEKVGSGDIKVFGHVKSLSGVPIENAFVYGTDMTTGVSASAATNKDGYYEFYVEENGTYNLNAFHCEWSRAPYLNDFIPEDKLVKIDKVSEMNADFNLKPAGNIILYVYDNEGELLRNKQLTAATSNNFYVTDLKSIPQNGSYRPLHDAYSQKQGWDPDLSLPNFVVSPRVDNEVHLLWEIPNFGKLGVTIDNEGKGYRVPKQGGAIGLRGRAKITSQTDD